MSERSSDSDPTKRDIPSFIEPRPPLILNPFMRPKPQKGTNLLELFEEDSESEEPEWLQVYLRLKPCNVKSNLYQVKSDRCLITSVDTATMGHGRRTQHHVPKLYTFSHIFGPEADQKQIFEHVVKENLKKLPDGHNFTLLTYGASGSGKTYTLMGTVQAPGLVPRSLEYVFRIVEAAQQPLYKPCDGNAVKLDYYNQDYEIQFVKKLCHSSVPLRDKYRRMSVQLRNDMASTLDLSNRTRYYVWVSFVEIYNEAIYDLLTNSDRSKATSKLRIREDANGNVYVKGATQAFVRTGEEAYDVMVAGKHNLQVAATGVHANSSRSHCIFTITMLTETEEGVRSSCVRLCDLAGCERQRTARNTGARMQESRAINSSLHVLERCLHMLRRKQKRIDATLVPYRESKLTRLLGAGLCGARGEAVSMVVTLTPAPHAAHETRHVLQLAAVAKDIQVNHTIQESTLESSVQDSTMEPSVELMRLRTDNERLHFELIQAQSQNKALLVAMEEKQQEVARTMYEILEEAKDMTRQYYEAEMQLLRDEMKEKIEETQEEYELKLKAIADGHSLRASDTGTPSKANKREKLTEERLARVRAEEEVQHLRACIEERDEQAQETSKENQEVICVTDESESEEEEEEEDPYKDSLEPIFKKEDINRSRLLRRSLLNDSTHHDTTDIEEVSTINEVSTKNDHYLDTDNDEKNETLRDEDETHEETVEDSTYVSDDSSVTENFEVTQRSIGNDSNVDEWTKNFEEQEAVRTKCSDTRGTYVVKDDVTKHDETKATAPESSNIINSFENIKKSTAEMEESSKMKFEVTQNGVRNYFKVDAVTKYVEELEAFRTKCSDSRGTYFVKDDVTKHNETKATSPEYSNILNSFENIKKPTPAIGESSKVNLEKSLQESIDGMTDKFTDPIVNRLLNRKSTLCAHPSEDSLANFERLEIELKSDNANPPPMETLSDILKQKRNFFDNDIETNGLIPKFDKSNKKKYFSNIKFDEVELKCDNTNLQPIETLSNIKIFDDDVTTKCLTPQPLNKSSKKEYYTNIKGEEVEIANKNLNEVKNLLDEERSPSIVKDDDCNNSEPSTIKKLLGESFTISDRYPVVSSLPKKHVSLDIFEGFDSPKVVKEIETNKTTAEKPPSHLSQKNDDKPSQKIDERPLHSHLQKNDDQNNVARCETSCNDLNNRTINDKNSDIFIKPKDVDKSVVGNESFTHSKHNASIFELCIEKNSSICSKDDIIGNTCKSIRKMCLTQSNHKHKLDDIKIKLERTSVKPENNEHSILSKSHDKSESEGNHSSTVEQFNNIYKDVTPNVTEFELLISQNSNINESKFDIEKDTEKPKYNLRHTKLNISADKETNVKKLVMDENLDNKANPTNEVPIESQPKCESKTKPKRNLRLRRRKNDPDSDEKAETDKLKDIVNLQKEFSDVTMDVAAPLKELKDIESPEEKDDENLPPVMGIASCPSKSVTRSRRKLFTPRAEPCEEFTGQSGDSNERVRVPRPSYHRTRARRKL